MSASLKGKRRGGLLLSFAVALLAVYAGSLHAEPPEYYNALLYSIYPAGAQRGTTVTVEMTGFGNAFSGATELIIDGAPGITVEKVEPADKGLLRATLAIAADATPGRRMIRVKGGPAGLTNFRYFFVGELPEYVEGEKPGNNTPESAEPVQLPVVINGRVNPTLDEDCFHFQARAGQKIVAAVMAHGLDAMGFDRTSSGFVDTSLELLDEQGRVLNEAEDTIGFDPLIEQTIPADGSYTVRIRGMGYKGFPQAVYRLTLGEIPYPVAVFPAGGKRGETVEVEFFGPNCNGLRQQITITDEAFPWQFVSPKGMPFTTELPMIRGDFAEAVEVEGNSTRKEADELQLPLTMNARFDMVGDEDWYRFSLQKGETVYLEVLGQRHLDSPIDTLLEVFDAKDELVAANDDGEIFGGECTHDFKAFDSALSFTAKEAGDYFIRLTEQTGASGIRAVYRLTAQVAEPDFRAFQWPDAVPIWGAGSTATLPVEVIRLNGLKSDIEMTIEGLPEGWKSSTAISRMTQYRAPNGCLGTKSFLSITAPKDVELGTMVPVRVVCRATVDDRIITHEAQSLTLYVYGEPHRFRFSPQGRIVIAPPTAPALTTTVEEIEAIPGEKVEIPVAVHPFVGESLEGQEISLSVDEGKGHFLSTFQVPTKLIVKDGQVVLPVTIPESRAPGNYEIVVSNAWAGDVRKGLPGPCTPLIRLKVNAKN